MIRKIKQINEKNDKQYDNDEYDNRNSNKEDICDLSNNVIATSKESPTHQKERSPSTSKLHFRSLSSLERERNHSFSNSKNNNFIIATSNPSQEHFCEDSRNRGDKKDIATSRYERDNRNHSNARNYSNYTNITNISRFSYFLIFSDEPNYTP